MSQSALLIAALIALFVVFLAARGRLATYASVFYGAKSKSGGTAATKTSGGSSTASTALDIAKIAAVVFA